MTSGMRSICRGAEPRRLIRNSAGDMNFSSAKKKRPSSRNRLRCSVAERTRRPASKPTARVYDHFVSNSVRPDDVIVNVTSRLSTVWPRPVRLKISGTLSPVRSRSTIPSRTMVSLRTGAEARTVASSVAIILIPPSPTVAAAAQRIALKLRATRPPAQGCWTTVRACQGTTLRFLRAIIARQLQALVRRRPALREPSAAAAASDEFDARGGRGTVGADGRHDNPAPRSAPPVIREDVVSRLHDRMARESTLGVVPLRRHVGRGSGPEPTGRSLVLENGPSPPAGVRKSLTVPHHKVDVMERARHRRCGERLHLFRVPVDLRHLGAIGEWLPVARNAGPVGVNHHGIGEDRSKQASVLTDRDNVPVFVSPELGEREPTGHLHSVLVLGGHGAPAQGTDECRHHSNRPHASALHNGSLLCQTWRP